VFVRRDFARSYDAAGPIVISRNRGDSREIGRNRFPAGRNSRAAMIAAGLASLSLFALVTSVSPGPANALVMYSAAQGHVARTVGVVAGLFVGFESMLVLASFGISGAVFAEPRIAEAMKLVTAAYLVFLAVQILRAPLGDAARPRAAHSGFVTGALLNWANPKAWIMAFGAVSLTAAYGPILRLVMVCGTFCVTGFISVAVWVGAGASISRAMRNENFARWVNRAMAGALVFSAALTVVF
jgi:threonine/homoserine/homoserine lactone efflux protein